MAINIMVPEMGESVGDARVARWLKHAGDVVTVGEPLVELETDKVTVEVPSPSSATLEAITKTAEKGSPDALCTVSIYDAETNTLHHVAGMRLPHDYLTAKQRLEIGPRNGSCAAAIFLLSLQSALPPAIRRGCASLIAASSKWAARQTSCSWTRPSIPPVKTFCTQSSLAICPASAWW